MKTRTTWYIDPASGPWWCARVRRWVTIEEACKLGGSSCATARTYRRALALARAAQLVEDCEVDISSERRGKGGKWRNRASWTLPRRDDR